MKANRVIEDNLRMLIVDDHKLVRQGIKYMLDLQSKYDIDVDEAESGEVALKMIDVFDYDIILMDINMPNGNGISVTKEVMKNDQNAKIIALSMHDESFQIKEMILAGAKGYLLKNTGSEEMVTAISTVMSGNPYYCNEVALKLMAGGKNENVDVVHYIKNREDHRKVKLSNREHEVLTLIANEYTNDEIANKLNLSKRTIDTHRQNILNKLSVRNTAGLIKYAINQGII